MSNWEHMQMHWVEALWPTEISTFDPNLSKPGHLHHVLCQGKKEEDNTGIRLGKLSFINMIRNHKHLNQRVVGLEKAVETFSLNVPIGNWDKETQAREVGWSSQGHSLSSLVRKGGIRSGLLTLGPVFFGSDSNEGESNLNLRKIPVHLLSLAKLC